MRKRSKVLQKLQSNVTRAIDGLDECYALVRDFQNTMSEPISTIPTGLEKPRRSKRCEWMHNEILELEMAEGVVDQVDALCDLIYFAMGTLVEMGVPPGIPFYEVHKSNMEKVGHQGRASFDETGRLKKPDGWQGPERSIESFLQTLKMKM